jgi:hypothetical protein
VVVRIALRAIDLPSQSLAQDKNIRSWGQIVPDTHRQHYTT